MKRFYTCALILTIAFISPLMSQKPHLIAYWPFDDGTANDYSGNGFNGTIVHSPRLVDGVKGKAFSFLGMGDATSGGDHITLPNIDFKKYKEFTISLWVKHHGLTNFAGEAYVWWGNHDAGWVGVASHCKQPIQNPPDETLYLEYSTGSYLYDINPIVLPFDNNYYSKWVHHVLIYKDGVMKSYVNGKLMGEMKQDIRIFGNAGCIACHYWGNNKRISSRFNGVIDEVKIFDTALTDEEIGNEYQPSDTTICHASSFDYKEFADISKFKLVGNANQLSNLVELTDFTRSKSGAIWYGQKVPVMKGFSTEFSFILNNGTNNESEENSSPGADGFTLVIQNDKAGPIGGVGGSIGYAGISNGVVVEFDSFINEGHSDPKSDHVAVMVRDDKGIILSDHNNAYCLGTSTNNVPVIKALNDKYFCKVDYSVKLKQLSVYIDQTGSFNAPALVIPNFDITKYINLSNGEFGFIGITSATGVAGERHMLTSWKACFVNTNTVLSNSEELSGSNDSQLSISPNPALDHVDIKFNAIVGQTYQVMVYDILGNVVHHRILMAENEEVSDKWNSINFSRGAYRCVVLSESGVITSKLVLK